MVDWISRCSPNAASGGCVPACKPSRRSRAPRRRHGCGQRVLVLVTAVFAIWLAVGQSRHNALEFVAGYAIETSLSVDNLFVFLVLFEGFRISQKRQHTALLWGVAGAIVLRALFIAMGVSLIERFDWITWIFGLFLLYAAFRLLRGGSARAVIPRWIRRLQPAKGSLLPVILAVEVHRPFVRRRFHPRRAGCLSRSLRGLHLKHRGNSRIAFALLCARCTCSTVCATCTTDSAPCWRLLLSRCWRRTGSTCRSRSRWQSWERSLRYAQSFRGLPATSPPAPQDDHLPS